ncbi:MAG: hypothetical protein HC795_09525 [Coleofasciculaceae cyanobacterium RL_1_1]|nr:hypothetical protein [Coleofasciculaceae cyanobacterium RL_1_1]
MRDVSGDRGDRRGLGNILANLLQGSLFKVRRSTQTQKCRFKLVLLIGI